jgi:glycosyltransferase involved in cell wall biosynthesis
MLITVFTPTYNRAKNLKALYRSLLTQTYTDFEWIIVDDGSNDDTKDLIQSFIDQNKINICYRYQKNSGKHIAINYGARIASGHLFFVVDSDDFLTPDSLERFTFHWNKLENLPRDIRDNIIGLAGNRARPNGEVIGGNPGYSILDTDLVDYRFNRKILGDKAEMYLTQIVKDNPFPHFEGETFCPEALVFYRLAQNGKMLRFFDENIYISEYLEGGLSLDGLKTLKRGLTASLLSYADVVGFNNISALTRIKYAILFWRFSFLDSSRTALKKSRMLPSPIYILLYPIGYIFYLKDSLSNMNR